MPSHWTYSEIREVDLHQGDLIARSDEVLSLLDTVHAHFCDDRYIAFMVVTQTCDLVQRKRMRCKSPYINLAVVRELEPMLPTMLSDVCGTRVPGVFDRDSRYQAEQLMGRIVNQNEQALGMFYLHPDADAGIATHAVAMLRVTISLWREHYGMLVEARCGRLAPEYANKLGWLTGNLYSRIATQDWEDQEANESATLNLSKALLRSASSNGDQNWVPARLIETAIEKGLDIASVSPDAMLDAVSQYQPKPPLDVLTHRVSAIFREITLSASLAKAVEGDTDFRSPLISKIHSVLFPSKEPKGDAFEELLGDRLLAASLAVQVQSVIKKHFRKHDDDSIDGIVDSLVADMGLLHPVSRRLKQIIAACPHFQAFDLNSLTSQFAELSVFSSIDGAAIQLTLAHDESLDRLESMVKRLRNDQQVALAIPKSLT